LIYLDTHAAVWLVAGLTDKFPERAREAIEGSKLGVSPMVVLEMQYLYEIGRVRLPAEDALAGLRGSGDLCVADTPFHRVVERALASAWTRDPFDRLIVAQADLEGAPLLTKDRFIHQHYPRALWDAA